MNGFTILAVPFYDSDIDPYIFTVYRADNSHEYVEAKFLFLKEALDFIKEEFEKEGFK